MRQSISIASLGLEFIISCSEKVPFHREYPSVPHRTLSSTQKGHSFSAPKIAQFHTKSPLSSTPKTPQFNNKNPSFPYQKPLRCVSSPGVPVQVC